MSLLPFLGQNLERFQVLFRAWFLSSGIDKTVAIAAESRLLVSTIYGSFKRKDVVVLATTNGGDILDFLRTRKIGLLLATEGLDDMSGDLLIEESLKLQPDLRSVLMVDPHILSREPHRVYKSDVVIATCDMLKPDHVLRAGILAALGGARYRSPSIDSLVPGLGIELSVTERKILEFYASGFTLDEMAERLPYTKNTVKTYSRNLMQKLGVGNRQKAISAAIALGFTDLLGGVVPHNRS
jgi:DNA-binding NarL/FixJ family response regulator